METQKKFEVIRFNVHHLEVMDIRDQERRGVMSLPDTKTRFELMAENSIDAKTFMYDGRILFVAGYYQLWEGVVECWMIPSEHVKTATLGFCKILKAYVDDIIEEQNCHRFQTTAPDDELHARWMRFLGLEKEGVMKKYTHDKQDECMYARVL